MDARHTRAKVHEVDAGTEIWGHGMKRAIYLRRC